LLARELLRYWMTVVGSQISVHARGI